MATPKQIAANRRTAKRLQKQGKGLWGMSSKRKFEIAQRNGRKAGADNVKLGRGIWSLTPEEKAEACSKGGLKTAEHTSKDPLVLFGLNEEQMAEAIARGGEAQGTANTTSGHIQKIQEIGAPLGGKMACHIRWHVLRDRKPNSKYCVHCDGPKRRKQSKS